MNETKEKIPEFVPWEIHVFPKEIQQELERRKLRHLDFVSPGNQYEEDYRGPMRAWVRVCSNGMGVEINNTPPKPGFVLYGGNEFYNAYGFNKGVDYESLNTNESIIGYTPDGMPHVIENDVLSGNGMVHVPPPQIISIETKTQRHLFRKTQIEWVCFSQKQLEYMTPYFLALGISVIIEWGWNNFNIESLLDLNDIDELKRLHDNQNLLYERILKSHGNYDVVFGIISNFSWRIEGNKINCTTEISSLNRVLLSQQIDDNIVVQSNSKTNCLDSFTNFVQNKIDELKKIIDYTKTSDDIIKDVFEGTKTETISIPSNPYVSNASQITVSKYSKEIIELVNYIKQNHPDNFKEYLFGIFFGRNSSLKSYDPSIGKPFNKNDFDNPNSKEWWINMGLLVEIINYYSSRLINDSGNKEKELFRVEIDDCVISSHPNLISSNGHILLVPNALAPRYFYGEYGYANEFKNIGMLSVFLKDVKDIILTPPPISNEEIVSNEEYFINEYRHILETKPSNTPSENKILKKSDLILNKVIKPFENIILRDDLSKIINHNRILFCGYKNGYEFPFNTEYKDPKDPEKKYNPYFCGFLKNLYFNVNELKRIVKEEKITDFLTLYERIFQSIKKATGGFINLMLINTGENLINKNTNQVLTLKITDLNLGEHGSNKLNDMYVFDYMEADSNILSLTFNPMPHYAQTADILYNVRKSDTEHSYPSTSDQILEYKFSDRIFRKTLKVKKFGDDSFKSMMQSLQSIKPVSADCFQMVIKQDNKDVYYRLAIPAQYSKLLNLLLADNDRENNPLYTGIMPNIQMSIVIQGIGGIRTFSVFGIRNLPEPYSIKNILFQTTETVDTISNGVWKTSITAGIRLRRNNQKS